MPQPRQTKRYFTDTTFTKAMRPVVLRNAHGVDVSKKWTSQRISNEAAALQYVRENTTNIPVPRVIEVGEGEHGTYITVERLGGVPLDEIGQQCRQRPSGGDLPKGHQAKRCRACQQLATHNASAFIQDTMLPQLDALRFDTSGLNDVVIPPPWVTEYDRRETWKPKVSGSGDAFVFCHGDLGPQNVLIDTATFSVCGVVDWENAGFYPRGFTGQWSMDVDGYYNLYRDEALLDWLVSLLG